MNEIVSDKDTSKIATILLNQDIKANAENSALYRLSDSAFIRPSMVQLLQFLAAKPNSQLVNVIIKYFQVEYDGQRPFAELYQFIQQGLESANPGVQALIAELVSKLLSSYTVAEVATFGVDLVSLAQQQAASDDPAVYRFGVSSLLSLIVGNYSKEGDPSLTDEQVGSFVGRVIAKIAHAIETQAPLPYVTRMMTKFRKTAEIESSQLLQSFPQIVAFLESVLQADLDDGVKKPAVIIFQELCANEPEMTRQVKSQVQQFIMKNILPNCAATDEQIQSWLESQADYHFDDDSLQTICGNCISDISAIMGKSIIQPLLNQCMGAASQGHTDPHFLDAILVAMTNAGDALENLLK